MPSFEQMLICPNSKRPRKIYFEEKKEGGGGIYFTIFQGYTWNTLLFGFRISGF